MYIRSHISVENVLSVSLNKTFPSFFLTSIVQISNN